MGLAAISRAIRPLSARLSALVTRGKVTLVDPSKPIQRLQVDLGRGDIHDRIARFQTAGLATYPRIGSEAVILFPGGTRERGIAIAVDDRRDRFALENPGEVALYNPEAGTSIHLADDGSIRVVGDLLVDGSVVAASDVSDGDGSLRQFRSAYNQHIHQTPSGPSGPPNPQALGGLLQGGAVPPAPPPQTAPSYAFEQGSHAFGPGETYYRAFGELGDWFAYRHLSTGVSSTPPEQSGPLPTSPAAFAALAYPITVS